MIDLQSVMRIVKNDSKLKIKIFSILTPNRSLDTICIILLTMVLFPNILYFLIGILLVFVT